MKKGKEKIKRGISLIVLVITIIVIIILATAVIVTILDNNPISSAIRAVDESNVSKYTEQIEQIRAKLLLQNENHELPNLQQMKEALDKEKWVNKTEMIMDEGIEKLKLTTKEGYIFYITADDVEYKGKGEVVDTSALKRDDVIELIGEEETTKGQYVKITSKAEDYYVIKYKIGEEEKWIEIENGGRVEVPFGSTIYAKLFFGSNSGVEFKLKIGDTNPSIVVKEIDTSNIKRKTDIVLADLFDITWGSEGTGNIEYEVTGNMLFNNTSYENVNIENTKELELGTYNVKCALTSPSGYEASAQKQVRITTLANTTVIDESNNSINANAIYSEYDLAHFRDLVNDSNYNINGKIMNEIDMQKVCVNNWLPIGYAKNNFTNTESGTVEYVSYYSGIFDGNNNNILNLKIEDTNSQITLGLFGAVNEGIVKNIIFKSGSIKGKCKVGSAIGYNYKGKIEGIKNEGVSINSIGFDNYTGYVRGDIDQPVGSYTYKYSATGGIVGCNIDGNILDCENSVAVSSIYGGTGGIIGIDMGSIFREIKNCKNTENVTTNATDTTNSGFKAVGCAGGIVGTSNYNSSISNCENYGNITANLQNQINGYEVGGVVGHIIGGWISGCVNEGNITGTTKVGGITGSTFVSPDNGNAFILSCTNRGDITSNSYVLHTGQSNSGTWTYPISCTGGIVGVNNIGQIQDCHNYGKITAEYDMPGGIVGINGSHTYKTIKHIINCTNNNIVKTNTKVAGGIIGAGYYTNLESCSNVANITGKKYQIAGIAGYALTSTFENCINSGTCEGVQEIAGIAGWVGYILNGEKSYIKKCTNTGVIIDNGVEQSNKLYAGGSAIIE